MNSYDISGRGKECIKMFTSLVSAIWDQRQMSFILLYGFLPDFFEHSCLCLSSTQEFSLFPVTAITCERSGSVDA